MFNKDFYPTEYTLIERMMEGIEIEGKIFLEPSAGKGDIVKFIQERGGEVIACEIEDELSKIVGSYCQVIEKDFLHVRAEMVSHVDYIIMNPPFSDATKHIQHAIDVAPDGCGIISLANANTFENQYTRSREKLVSYIEAYGNWENIGPAFSTAERTTNVDIALVKVYKPNPNGNTSEFDGFLMDEVEERQEDGVIGYNFIRDIVNRYTGAVKIFDEQLETATRLNELTSGFFNSSVAISLNIDKKAITRASYKKEIQKSAWMKIFEKMDMDRFITTGLKSDLNKFVEKQHHVPFTMANVYRMIDIIAGTHEQRMDAAITEVFDRVTERYSENRYNVEGWKTNSHYMLGKKFILPYVSKIGYSGHLDVNWNGYGEIVDDMNKAICYIMGVKYDVQDSLHNFVSAQKRSFEDVMSDERFIEKCRKQYEYFERDGEVSKNTVEEFTERCAKRETHYERRYHGVWYDWNFFRIKGFKKGTMHFEFKDNEVWAMFNRKVAEIKGFPLPEKI